MPQKRGQSERNTRSGRVVKAVPTREFSPVARNRSPVPPVRSNDGGASVTRGNQRTQPSPASYVIEPVQTGDIRAVMRLAWKTTSHLYPAIFFEEIAERQPEYFRVVKEATTAKVVGFIIAAKQPGLTQNFMLLAVEPTLVGQGLRRRMLAEVQGILRSEGVRSFTVEVPAGDGKLLDLYRREGFEIVGVERTGTDDERLVVGKPIR